MDTENNQLTLCGVIENTPVLDHEVFGENFYRLDIRVPRLSGASDLLPVTVSERLMNSQVTPGVRITIHGQLRSYNKVMGGAGRLLLTAFAQRLLPPDDGENRDFAISEMAYLQRLRKKQEAQPADTPPKA